MNQDYHFFQVANSFFKNMFSSIYRENMYYMISLFPQNNSLFIKE